MLAPGTRPLWAADLSLRDEAARRGVSVYQVRRERGVARALERGEPIPTARRSVGHYRLGEERPGRRVSAFLAGPPRDSTVVVSVPDARRIGRHAELVRLLVEGGQYRGTPMTPARFRRLVSRWAPITVLGGDESPGRYLLVSDPGEATVLRDLRREEGRPGFEYEVIG